MDSHADDELIPAIRRAISSQIPEPPDVEAMRQRFWAQHEADTQAPKIDRRTLSRTPGRLPKRATAATSPTAPYLILGLGAAAAAFSVFVMARGSRAPSFSSNRSGTTQTYVAHAGQRARIRLADGSTAILAPMSTLRVRGTAVELSGEAYFTVRHTPATPFTVRTGDVTTRVLGTAFTIKRYPHDPETIVAVASGKVSVSDRGIPRDAATVTAGAVAHAADSSVTVTQEDIEQYTAWTSGHLVFRDTPLSQLLETVGRWYGVEFRIPDSTLAKQRITSTIDFGSRAELLHALSVVLDITATYDRDSDSIIVIRARGNSSTVPVPRRGTSVLPTMPEVGR